ncbi:UNVERIFIED_CONTAM: hypothetical protein GTU68_042490, partial [Idotea baltica]|nr:hypothetical protein [Idotea baltica]
SVPARRQVCGEVKPVREQHLHLLQDISQTLTSLPHPYPRFFFQRLQQTTITLNLSPQPRTPSDPICVMTSGHLVIKVEGVIVHGRHCGLYRNVQTVSLAVSVDASVTDMEDDAWKTGPCLSLSVKAQDDPSGKSAAGQSRPPPLASLAPSAGPSRAPQSTSGVTVEPYTINAPHQMMQYAPARPAL